MALFRKLMNGGDTQQVAVAEDLDTQIARAQDVRHALEALVTLAQVHLDQIPPVNGPPALANGSSASPRAWTTSRIFAGRRRQLTCAWSP